MEVRAIFKVVIIRNDSHRPHRQPHKSIMDFKNRRVNGSGEFYNKCAIG
jgi:hypothetical protein